MDFESLVINKLDKLDEKLNKVQEDVTDLKIENIKQTINIETNTKDLTLHKEGVIQNRARIKWLEDRAKPPTVKQFMKKAILYIGGIGTVGGAIITILKLIYW